MSLNWISAPSRLAIRPTADTTRQIIRVLASAFVARAIFQLGLVTSSSKTLGEAFDDVFERVDVRRARCNRTKIFVLDNAHIFGTWFMSCRSTMASFEGIRYVFAIERRYDYYTNCLGDKLGAYKVKKTKIILCYHYLIVIGKCLPLRQSAGLMHGAPE